MSATSWTPAEVGPAGLWPPGEKEPLVSPSLTYSEVTRAIAAPVEGRPGTGWWIAFLAAGALLVTGFALIGPIGAVVLGAAAAVTLRLPRSRPLLTVGGPVLFALTVGWMVATQLFRELPPGFDWPTYFEGAQDPAWIAVLLLLLDAVVDRCWLRRWWPTDDADT